MYRAILFDLDGTLTASGEGITKSIQYALHKCGIEEPDLAKLEVFIGPPLMEQFMKYCNFTEEQARQAIVYYRERYTDVGIYENQPYPGIIDLLADLREQGYLLAVASSKPTVYVRKILDHFEMTQYFHEIVGAEMDGRRTQKAEVIAEALRLLHMEGHRDEVIMVGDKEHDVYGARAMGLKCVAVTYGYGTMEELTRAKPYYYAENTAQLGDFFFNSGLIRQSLPRKIFRILYPIGTHFLVMQLMSLMIMGLYLMAGANPVNGSLVAVGFCGLAVIPLCVYWMKQDNRLRTYTDSVWNIQPPDLLLTFLLGVCYGQIFNTLLGMLNLFEIFPSYQDTMTAMTENTGVFSMILWIGIVAPVAEELVFRGLVYQRLKDYVRPGTAMVLSALAFGIYHGNMLQFIYATILGLLFVCLMERARSLWGSIAAHIGANCWSVILSCYSTKLLQWGNGMVLAALIFATFVGGCLGIFYLKGK